MFDTSMPWLHEPSTRLSFPFLSFSSTTTEVTGTHHSPFSIHTPSTSNILKLPKLTATQVRRPVKESKITAQSKGLTFQLIDRLAILAAYSKAHTHKLPLHIGSSQISLLWIFVCKLAFFLPLVICFLWHLSVVFMLWSFFHIGVSQDKSIERQQWKRI